MHRQPSDYVIQSADRMIDVLHALVDHGDLGVTDVARLVGLHKNNAFRALATLEHREYVEQSGSDGRYRLGPRCGELGDAFRRQNPLTQRARPWLEELAKASAESAHLGVRVGYEVLLTLSAMPPGRLLGIAPRQGLRLPGHATALGKVLLACAPAVVREAYDREVVSVHGLERYTPATIGDRDKFFEHLRAVASQGWALDREEYEVGLVCAAAPVFAAEGRLEGGLSISGPAARIDTRRLELEIVPAVVRAGCALSRELGYHG